MQYWRDKTHCDVIKKNLVACKVGIRAKVLRDNDFEWKRAGRCARLRQRYVTPRCVYDVTETLLYYLCDASRRAAARAAVEAAISAVRRRCIFEGHGNHQRVGSPQIMITAAHGHSPPQRSPREDNALSAFWSRAPADSAVARSGPARRVRYHTSRNGYIQVYTGVA
ncbi:hypothetical protein EVAR_55951_1 [Eumeta japonica]|uniref:Uncharacterized protein n=1 Tax=Eumeta variegata TaxID=151549 RepID=A0A4C1YVG0_EUMVA|nr:hypothetical protein EVAR_55951_1 [Eumeta japonica]